MSNEIKGEIHNLKDHGYGEQLKSQQLFSMREAVQNTSSSTPDINKAYTWAIQTCNAGDVGYSQPYRNQQTVNGITYYDCSSFINYALNAGGFETPSYAPDNNAFTTYTMPSALLSLGFTEVDPNGEYLAGDIGVNPTHTEMCYTGGQGAGTFMGAHTANTDLANQVSISNYTRSFERLFRYGNGASTYGYSQSVISAMCGNFWTESNINPAIWESLSVGTWTDLNKGYGLGQWTNTGGDTQGRLYQLKAWLDAHGYTTEDGNAQCEYITAENYWTPKTEYPQFTSLSDFLNSTSTDLTTLTHAWNWCWEGIHDASWDTRVTQANTVYDYITEHANDTSITDWIYGNRYLSTDEILNNAVMMYRYFSAGGGGGGTPSLPKTKMPVWMKIRYW